MFTNEICNGCLHQTNCEITCNAIVTLAQYCRIQKDEDKRTYLRHLSKSLLCDARPSRELRALADKLIRRFPEFHFISEYGIKIGYVISYEKKGGDKTVYADCRKLNDPVKAYLPFDFIITFYDHNAGLLNENQKKLLMLHELKHVMIGQKGLKVRPHDIEDFQDILTKYGLDWSAYGKELPDILAGE